MPLLGARQSELARRTRRITLAIHTGRQGRGPDRYVFGDYVPYPFFMGYASTYLAQKTGVDVTMPRQRRPQGIIKSYFKWLDGQRFDYIFIESASPSWTTTSK